VNISILTEHLCNYRSCVCLTLQEVPSTLWFMAVTLDRKKDRLFDFIQEQIRLSLLPATKAFITGICLILCVHIQSDLMQGNFCRQNCDRGVTFDK